MMILLAAVLPVLSYGQDRPVDTLFGAHAGESGYTSVTYGSKMLGMMKKDADKKLAELLDGIKIIRMISGSPEHPLRDEARAIAKKAGYELISAIDENGSSTAFYFKEESGYRSSFLMITSGDKGDTVLDIYGKFDIRDISRLSVMGR